MRLSTQSCPKNVTHEKNRFKRYRHQTIETCECWCQNLCGGENELIVFFTHFGAVFRNEEVEDRDSMVFVYHTRKTEGKVWIGNDHSYKGQTMVDYHEMVFEVT